MNVQRLNAVLIDSSDAWRLVAFYRDKVGLPLEEDRHGSEPHWACFLGGLHFAIHQKEGLQSLPRNTAISFAVADVDEAIADLKRGGVVIEIEPQTRPFGRLAALRDPDGNLIYVHQYES